MMTEKKVQRSLLLLFGLGTHKQQRIQELELDKYIQVPNLR